MVVKYAIVGMNSVIQVAKEEVKDLWKTHFRAHWINSKY